MMDGRFSPVLVLCCLWECHLGQWLFKKFFIIVSSLFSLVKYLHFSRPPPPMMAGVTAEVARWYHYGNLQAGLLVATT